MKNELQRHKTSDKIKWVCTGIAFLLVFVLLAGICLQLFATDKFKPSEWFKPECEHIYNNDGICETCGKEKPAENNELIVTPMNSKTIRLAAVPMSANTNDGIATYSDITTVSVTNVMDYLDYEWTLSDGGDTYISLSATTGTSITVSAKQAFGTQIVLTCTAKYDGNVVSSATCSLDYEKRIDCIQLNGVNIARKETIDLRTFTGKSTFKEALKSADFNFSAVTGVGSVGEDYTVHYVNVSFTNNGETKHYLFDKSSISFAEFVWGGFNGSLDETYINQMRNGTYQGTEMLYGFGIATTTWTVEVLYEENILSNYTFYVHFPSGWQPYTYNLNLNQGNIVF